MFFTKLKIKIWAFKNHVWMKIELNEGSVFIFNYYLKKKLYLKFEKKPKFSNKIYNSQTKNKINIIIGLIEK